MKKLRLWLLILPFALYYFGLACNMLVISVNQGAMPVSVPFSEKCLTAPPASQMPTLDQLLGGAMAPKPIERDCRPGETIDHVHRIIKSDDHLILLSDWIQVHWEKAQYSIGDGFMLLGEWLQPYCIGGWFILLIVGYKESR